VRRAWRDERARSGAREHDIGLWSAVRGTRRLLLLGACALLIPTAQVHARCAEDEPEGLGGTGLQDRQAQRPDPEGLGGTGRAPGDEPEGLGGTGIIGAITGFGSVCINGLEVEVEADTRVEIDDRSASVTDLAVGQVVQIEADASSPQLRARRISLRNVVSGPVDSALASGTLLVLGQRVVLGPETVLVDRTRTGGLSTEALAPGLSVEVSGFRRADGSIAATRIEVVSSTLVRVTGRVADVAVDRFRVGGLEVRAFPGREPVSAGQVVRLSGRLRDGVLVPTQVTSSPRASFARAMSYLVLEGYAEAGSSGASLRVNGIDIDLSKLSGKPSSQPLPRDRRLRVRGRLEDSGRLVAERIDLRDSEGADGRWRSLGGGSRRQQDDDRSRSKDRGERDEDDRRGRDDNDRERDENRSGRDTSGRDEDRSIREDLERDDRSGPGSGDSEVRPESTERLEREDRSGPGGGDRVDRPESIERLDSPERIERLETPERPERIDRSGPSDRVERPDRVDRPERTERPERPERSDRPERIERPDRSGRGN